MRRHQRRGGSIHIPKNPDPRTILANERTYLSWLRTGVALMAFGFVLSKFDLFLHWHHTAHSTLPEQGLGLIFVGGGVFVIGFAGVHFHRNRIRLEQGLPLTRPILPLILGGVLALLGLLVFFYLAGLV